MNAAAPNATPSIPGLTERIHDRIATQRGTLVWAYEVSLCGERDDIEQAIQDACAGLCGWIGYCYDEWGNIERC